jgi:polyisoprenoid-binding protein YceI
MNMRFSYLVALIAATTTVAIAQTSTWVPDKAHSEADFSVVHLGLAKVHGHFGNIGGTVVTDDSDITKSKVNITVDVSTVDTGVAGRDNDLKSGNFFDVAQFPSATFVSTGVEKAGSGLTVNGNLTLHGVTRPVTLQVQGPTGPVKGMDQKPHSGFSGSTTISRSAFGIGSKVPNAVVGDEITLNIELDVAKQ